MIKTKIIDGKAFAATLRADIAQRVTKLKTEKGITPGLAVVLVGNDPASEVYVRNKIKQTKEAGMNSYEFVMPEATTQDELIQKVYQLNDNSDVHGILVQLPLPEHINEFIIIDAIKAKKDVDGFHLLNIAGLALGVEPYFTPCTPLGCLMLLKDTMKDLSGKHAVIIGRSNIVGKPMAALLLKENCTVTIAHSKTKDLPSVVKLADIVVAAVGKPEMVKGSWLKQGAVVIDVGINRVNGKLVGDVDFASCLGIASAITPVPGGVGPMTIACLLENTLKAASLQHGE